MPHLILEYTSGLSAHIAIQDLLKELHTALGTHHETNITPDRIVSRAHETRSYIVYDDHAPDHFVNIELRLVPGRSDETVKSLCLELQDTTRRFMQRHQLECVIKVNPVDLHRLYCP